MNVRERPRKVSREFNLVLPPAVLSAGAVNAFGAAAGEVS